MNLRRHLVLPGIALVSLVAFAAPVIDPIPNASIPAGRSLTIPITASSSNPASTGLTFTVTSSTNRITVEVHTNNPFWKMTVVQAAPSNAPGAFQTPFRGGVATVTNLGDLTFILLKDRAPRTVDAISGFTFSGFYDANTIFHRVAPGFVIQGGDPNTNGTGGPVFRYENNFHPREIFSGNGQLAMANSGKDTDGSQFFVTAGPQRFLDFGYTIFGQLERGFGVLTNIFNVQTNGASRPLADVIIARAALVPDTTDTAITLTATNLAGISGTIRVIADDGAGGRTTNSFTATTVTNTSNALPFIYPDTATNLVGPVNARLTNYITGLDLETNTIFWTALYLDANSTANGTNTTLTITNNLLRLVVVPNTNYSGPLGFVVRAAPNGAFTTYDQQIYRFGIGDTKIQAAALNFTSQALAGFSNQLLATFTNGVPDSSPSNFTASINWGDNSVNPGTILTNAGGRKEVRGAHTYNSAGTYPVYVTVRSALGAEAAVISTALVPPGLTLSRSGTNNILRWPSWANDYSIQSQTNLDSTNWITVTNPAGVSGYDIVATNGSAGSSLFLRLKK